MLHPDLLEKASEVMASLAAPGERKDDNDDGLSSIISMLGWVARTRPDMPPQVEELVMCTIADMMLQCYIAHSMGYDMWELKDIAALNAINERVSKEMARLLGVPWIDEEHWQEDDPRKSPPVGIAIFGNPEDGFQVSFMTEDEFDKRDHAETN